MGTPRILIIGGYGETGRRIARHLLERRRIELVIAGRNRQRAETLAVELNSTFPDSAVLPLQLDAADITSVRKALEGVNILIQAGLAFKNVSVLAEATLDAGADWLDVQFDPRSAAALETLQSKIETAGRCFITQGGFHPGVPAALVRWAAMQVDELETADVIGVLRPKGGMQYTEAVEELIDLFRDYLDSKTKVHL